MPQRATGLRTSPPAMLTYRAVYVLLMLPFSVRGTRRLHSSLVLCRRKVTGLQMPTDIYPGDEVARVKTVESNKLETYNKLRPHLNIQFSDSTVILSHVTLA